MGLGVITADGHGETTKFIDVVTEGGKKLD
jgi:hypothetical protein